jgi:hypothetical protein
MAQPLASQPSTQYSVKWMDITPSERQHTPSKPLDATPADLQLNPALLYTNRWAHAREAGYDPIGLRPR